MLTLNSHPFLTAPTATRTLVVLIFASVEKLSTSEVRLRFHGDSGELRVPSFLHASTPTRWENIARLARRSLFA